MKKILIWTAIFAFIHFQDVQAQVLDHTSSPKSNIAEVYQPKYPFYEMGYKSVSDNAKWITFYKIYDDNKDTLTIVNTDNPTKIIFRTKIKQQLWLEGDCMAVNSEDGIELLDLHHNTSVKLEPMENIWFLKSSHQLLLYSKHTLQVYDSRTKTKINSFDNIDKVLLSDDFAFVSKKKDQSFELYMLTGNKLKYIASTDLPVFNVERTKNGSLLIYERKKNGMVNLRYISPEQNKTFILGSLMNRDVKSIKVTERKDGELFLKVEIPIPKLAPFEPDLWSTTDSKLLEKFSKIKVQHYLWYPLKNIFIQLDKEKFDRIFDVGNKDYLLAYDPWEFQDYTARLTPAKLYRMSVYDQSLKLIDTVSGKALVTPNGTRLLYQKNSFWKLVDLSDLHTINIGRHDFKNPYFIGNELIYFEAVEGIWEYDLKKNSLDVKYKIGESNFTSRILNGSSKVLNFHSFTEPTFSLKTLDPDKILIEAKDEDEQLTAIFFGTGSKLHELETTQSRLTFIPVLSTKGSLIFTKENYNQTKSFVKLQLGERPILVYQSNKVDKEVSRIKAVTISFVNSRGHKLKGLLYYPLDFDELKRYPMVVHLYEKQSDKIDLYPMHRYEDSSVGFNIRSLIEKGYFVLMPDLALDERGTGLSALDGVEKALDALASVKNIDFQNVALMGHSFGGYQANFIATHSNRFKTYISGSGFADIVGSYFSFNYDFLSPLFWEFEVYQFELGGSYTQNKELYRKNNPIDFVEMVSVPMLLWTGKKDRTVDPNQTMEFYLGLKRNGKNAIALFYPDEPHYMSNKEVSKDLHSKVLDWLDYYLKGLREAKWIEQNL